MRDPNRIKEFCDVLEREWSKVPDWRFGQFICNFLGEVCAQTKQDIFFIEDAEMKKFLENYFEEIR